jgi:hypothetical protein
LLASPYLIEVASRHELENGKFVLLSDVEIALVLDGMQCVSPSTEEGHAAHQQVYTKLLRAWQSEPPWGRT